MGLKLIEIHEIILVDSCFFLQIADKIAQMSRIFFLDIFHMFLLMRDIFGGYLSIFSKKNSSTFFFFNFFFYWTTTKIKLCKRFFKSTKIQLYKRFLKIFNSLSLREDFQIIFQFTSLGRTLFCTYQQDKNIEIEEKKKSHEGHLKK